MQGKPVGNLASKVGTYPKLLLVLVVFALFITWPRTAPVSTRGEKCPAAGTRYGIMMDAGSTGSRTHVFEFFVHQSGEMELKREVFEELKPGLSSFKENPGDGAKSLLPLMEAAVREIPTGLTLCTPVALKATAGLRLIGRQQSEEILTNVVEIFHRYPFRVPPAAAVVMDGKDEGPYAWLTVNFLLGTLHNRQQKTAAILDMGGASTQIVFEPDTPMTALSNAPQEHIYEVSLQGKKFRTYQHSHLGFGLKEAGKSIKRLGRNSNRFVCFPPGHEDTIDGAVVANHGDSADFDGCVEVVKRIFGKDDECHHQSCSFRGVYQPPISSSFSGPVYAFSYFYDRMEPFLRADERSSVGEFREVGSKICSNASGIYAKHNRGTMCMDFAYLYTLLRVGYELPDETPLFIKKKINGIETAWALGAMLVSMETQ